MAAQARFDASREWPAARKALETARIAILEESLAEPELEDVFIELVGAAERGDE